MQKNNRNRKQNQMICIALLLAIVFLPIRISYGAEQVESGRYVILNGAATLNGYDGTGQREARIPEQILLDGEYYQVTAVGSNAFSNQQTLETIALPAQITAIHSSAFQNCTALEQINLPSELTFLGGSAFQNCSSLKEICLPANIRNIQKKTFYGCSKLQRVEILNERADLVIALDAFFSCPQLREIVVVNDAVAAIVAAHFKGKNIQIVNLSETPEPTEPDTDGDGEPTEPTEPDTGGDGEPTEPTEPDTGGDGEPTEPTEPDTGGDGEPTEPTEPDTGGDGEPTEPTEPDTGGDGEPTEPTEPDTGGDGEPTEPTEPDTGGDGEPTEPTEPDVIVPPNKEEHNSSGSGLQWTEEEWQQEPVESVFTAQTGGAIRVEGKSIFAVPDENYVFWCWSDGNWQRTRQQDFAGEKISAQFIPDNAVVTIQQNGLPRIMGWCAVRDKQLKFHAEKQITEEQREQATVTYGWTLPERQFSDWQQHPYQQVLQFAAQRNLFCGLEPDKMAPDAPFTKAMAAAVVHRLAMPTEKNVAGTMDAWYAADWQWAQTQGLFQEDAQPEEGITGADFQRCLWQLLPEHPACPPKFFAQRCLKRGEAAVLLQDFIMQTV